MGREGKKKRRREERGKVRKEDRERKGMGVNGRPPEFEMATGL